MPKQFIFKATLKNAKKQTLYRPHNVMHNHFNIIGLYLFYHSHIFSNDFNLIFN